MAEERVQRRLAAILAADVVGYSRQIREDEEGTLSRLKTCLKAVIEPNLARHGGRIVKTMGDGVLVEFSSAVDAVKSAVDLQTVMSERNASLGDNERMEFRVGVNLGDVVIDGNDIHGDGVNVAARLEGISEPGGICISGKVYEEVRDRIDMALEDLGEREVKNINRPVRVWRWSKTDTRMSAVAAPNPELPDKPSIAVLPFDNLSGDTEQDFIGDGLTEDIITGLSRIRSFFVIARNSTFQYRGTSPDIRRVAEDLGVRYVVEGSVRRSGDRVRVTVQLIDGNSGNHIWAERFDRELDDIFAVQDEITGSVVAQLEPELGRAEYERVKSTPPENMNAWELYHRGMVQYLKWGQAEVIEARKLFEQAIAHDPNLADAYAGLAMTIFAYWILQQELMENEKIELDCAADAAARAVELDGKSSLAHIALSRGHRHLKNADASISEAETAIQINPSSATGHAYLGVSYFQSGRAKEAIAHLKYAMRLSPADPEIGVFQSRLAGAYLYAGDCESATHWAQKALRTWDRWLPRAYLTAALAHLNRHEEAVNAREKLEAIKPGINIEFVQDRYPSSHPPYLSYLVEGLRKAGLPE